MNTALKSMLFSLYQHFRSLSPIDAILDTVTAMGGIIRSLASRSADAKILSHLRMAHCNKCEFYDPKWKTCGTPGDVMTGYGVRLKIGCWCYLPLANRDPEKDCYARTNSIIGEQGETIGWPDALRPKPNSWTQPSKPV